MPSVNLPVSICARCHSTLNSAFHPDAWPQPGDFSICAICNHVAVFDAQLYRRDPTEAELEEFNDPATRVELAASTIDFNYMRRRRRS